LGPFSPKERSKIPLIGKIGYERNTWNKSCAFILVEKRKESEIFTLVNFDTVHESQPLLYKDYHYKLLVMDH